MPVTAQFYSPSAAIPLIELLRQAIKVLPRAGDVRLGEQLMPLGKAQQHLVGIEH